LEKEEKEYKIEKISKKKLKEKKLIELQKEINMKNIVEYEPY